MSRRCQRHKERRRCSIQILDNFWNRSFEHKVTKKFADKLRSSVQRRCLRGYYFFVLIILRSLLFSVWYFFKVLNLGYTLITPNILKTHSWCYYFVPDYFVIWSLYTLLPCLFYLIFILSPLISCLPLNQQFYSFTRPFTCKQNLSTCKQNPIFLL